MSQITIGDKTLNFKNSAYTGDQWEQVASWVLNGGGTLIDENVEIVTQKASETLQAAQNAVASAQAADGSSDLSQSYAVGGTGTRDGENTDNAKYYSEQAGAVVNSLNNAHIDENGHLVYTSPGGSTVDLGEVVGSSIESIERTSGTGAPGTTDTYTVTLTNGNTTTFQVYNGKDGSGSGDMTKAVYDPQGKAQDIFAYADAKQAKITASGILKGNGAGGVSAAIPGTDYVASPEVFIATYGTTTYAEIKAAYDAGKVCLCKKETEIKQLIKISGSFILFSSALSTSALILWKIGYNDAWSEDVKGGYTPKSHASTHASGGDDPITPASIGAAVPSVGVTVTLRASGWNANAKTQTVSVAGVTATANLIITAAPDSYMAYAEAVVRCTAQGAGTLTFACETVPTADVASNVLILG